MRLESLETGIEAFEPRVLLSGADVQLIKDVNTVDAYPQNMTVAGTNLFYTVKDSVGTGIDLVVTNASGTRVLKDFVPGVAPIDSDPYSYYSYPSGPVQLTAVGNSVYFLASDQTSRNTLWVSDGTTFGTKQIYGGMTDSSYGNLTAAGGQLYYTVSYTSGTTFQSYLAVISPGAIYPTPLTLTTSDSISSVTAYGNSVYFTKGGDLWVSDGTMAGTSEYTYYDLAQNATVTVDNVNSIFIFNTSPFVSPLYFIRSYVDSTTFAYTEQLQGPTLAGLTTYATFNGYAATPSNFTISNSKLYFTASDGDSDYGNELWVFDGFSQAQMVKDIVPGDGGSYPANLTDLNGTLFFSIAGTAGQQQLWKSNGTAAGTLLVKDLGISSAAYPYDGVFARVGGALLFAAADPSRGMELWKTDGTVPGTTLVKDIAPGIDGSAPHNFVAFNGKAYFAAHDGSGPQVNQLWSSDGSVGGTSLVQSFSPGVTQDAEYWGAGFGILGNTILMNLNDGVSGPTLWKTDGTTSGTSPLAQVSSSGFVTMGGSIYFIGAGPAGDTALWTSDGTAAGTKLVKELPAYGSPLMVAGNRIYYLGSDAVNTQSLWVSDGTSAGTKVIGSFANSFLNVDSLSFIALGDKLIFRLDDGIHGAEPWVTDGTSAGTRILADIASSSTSSYPSSFVSIGGTAYFIASGANSASQLWKTDGTVGGTTLVYSFPGQSYGSNLTAVGSKLYFSVVTYGTIGTTGTYALWASDGTANGTARINAMGGTPFVGINSLLALGGSLLFVADDGSHGFEPWVSDGTAGGTRLVKDINPGSGDGPSSGGFYNGQLVSGGILYFAAYDGITGSELWQTDGTSVGTRQVAEINAGIGDSGPTPLAIKNGQLILLADDGVHGRELMSVTLNHAPAITPITALTANELSLFSYQVQATDADAPAQTLTYSLQSGAPAGMTINQATGLISWTPGESQGPGTYGATVNVTDNGVSNLVATASFQITVNEVNSAPVLAPIGARSVAAGSTLSFTAHATDPDLPAQAMTYSLAGAPAGMTIDSVTGVVTWTPDAYGGGGVYSVTVKATDNGSPALSAQETFTVTVSAVNHAPVLASIGAQSIAAGSTLSFTAHATDPDLPAQAITYSLAGAPAGASIDASTGLFTWTPGANLGAGNYQVTVVAKDSGSPSLTSSRTVSIAVTALSPAPSPSPTPNSTGDVVDSSPPPRIVSASVNAKKGLTLTLTLSGAIAPGAAGNPGNYQLRLPGRDKKLGTRDDKFITLTPSYAAGGTTLVLSTKKKVALSPAPRLAVFGSSGGNLMSPTGTLLDGDGDGRPGGDYSALVTKRGLTQVRTAVARAKAAAKAAGAGARHLAKPAGPLHHARLGHRRPR